MLGHAKIRKRFVFAKYIIKEFAYLHYNLRKGRNGLLASALRDIHVLTPPRTPFLKKCIISISDRSVSSTPVSRSIASQLKPGAVK
nr:unnamed protein product [Callosobruchus analis]